MPIFKGDNWQHLYKGDGHPAALYKGSKKLAGWTEESQAGVSHAYFDDTYNDKADVTIHGKSTQVTTTGAQLIDFSKASFINCSLENANTGTLKSNITDFYYGNIGITYLNEYLLSKRGETITFSAIDGIPEKMMSIIIYGKRANGEYYQEKNSIPGKNLVSLTVAQDFETITGVSLIFNRSSSKFSDTNTLVTGVMLNTGNTAIPFEPYTGGAPSPSPDYPQEITSVGDSGGVEVVSTGENLYSGGDIQGITKESSKKISVPCPGAPLIIKAIFVPVSGETSSYVEIRYYDGENKKLGANGFVTEIGTQNTDFVYHAKGLSANDGVNVDMTDVKKIDFVFSLNSTSNGEYDAREVMVCTDRNESEVMFSGYQSSTATFSTPNGLPGIPVDSGGNYTDATGQQWICDEIDTKAGVYRQRVRKVQYVGDTSEKWIDYSSEKYKGFKINLAGRKIAAFNHGLCNRFPVDMNANSTEPGIWIGSTSTSDVSDTIYFHNCNPSIASSVGEWRTWLSTHPVTLIYPLAAPVETPLSDAVDTFLGGTNLFISEHEMDVTVKTEDTANPTGA